MTPSPWPPQYSVPQYPAPVFNITCGAPSSGGDQIPVAESSLLPNFAHQTDEYLAEGVAPFLSIPLWMWIGLAGAAVWYFWGRHQNIKLPDWVPSLW